MEVAVLGPVEVRNGELDVPISATRDRAVLALLALRVGTAVSMTELIGALWGERPPRSAVKAVQMFVSNLRRIVPVGSIVTTPTGYRLDLRAEQVDAKRFEHLAEQGSQLLAAANAGRSAELLAGALGLWRGAPVPELAEQSVGQAEATRLEELRRGCEEDLADARMALGDHARLAAELEALVAAEPLRERRWAQLIRSHYACGRQAEALRTYQRLRKVLGDELGIEPSSELRRLEQAVLCQDPALAPAGEVGPAGSFGPPGTGAPDGGPDRTAAGGPVRHPLVGRGRPTVVTATALCADLSTAATYAASLAPAARRQFHRDHATVLSATAQAHGGEVVTMDDQVMVAAFSNPSSALACAVALQQAVEYENRVDAARPGLRVGLSTGEVTIGPGPWQGDPLLEARMLAAAAAGGEILAADSVRTTSRRRTTNDFTFFGDLDLSGLDGRVATVRVNWLPLPPDEPVVPLPESIRTVAGHGLFGRDDELAAIEEQIAATGAGNRRFFLVTGEPGIGKTALVAEAGRRAHLGGSVVLWGRCATAVGAPYQPFVEALSHYVTHAPASSLEAHVETYGGELTRLVPALARRIPACPTPTATEPDAERALAFGSAAGILTGAAGAQPVVVVVDDLHWADRPTVQLLVHLLGDDGPEPLVVLATMRSTTTPREPSVEAALSELATAGGRRIELAGIDDIAAEHLAEHLAAAALDDEGREVARRLRAETAGNPFFLVEMLRFRAEDGRAGRRASPATVRDVIRERVAHLGEPAAGLLELAAVIGPEFEPAVLGAVAQATGAAAEATGGEGSEAVAGPTPGGNARDAVAAGLRRAVDAALVTATDDGARFAFAHALVRQSLYESVEPVRCRRLHGVVASVLEDDPVAGADVADRFDRLAHHWSRSDHPDRALPYARLAAHRALEALAPDDAVGWFELALALQARHRPDDLALRADVLIGLTTGLRSAGEARHRDTMLEAAAVGKVLGDAGRLAAAVLAGHRGFWSAAGQVDAARVEALESALDLLPDTDSPDRARILATLGNELTFGAPLARRRDLAREAKAMAMRIGEPATTVHVLTGISDAIWVPETLDERLADSAMAVELAAGLDDPAAEFAAVSCRLRSTTEAGHVEDAARCLARMGVLADEVGEPSWRWRVAFAAACGALLDGLPAEAERLATEALDIGTRSGQPDAFTFYSAALYHVRWQQGRLEEVIPLLEAAIEENPGIPGYSAALAQACAESGRPERAAALLQQATACGFSHLPEDSLRSSALAMYADAAVELQARDAARVLYEILAPWHNQFVYMGVALDGPASHALAGLAGVLGWHKAASAHFAESQEMCTRTGATFFTARTQLGWGRELVSHAEAADTELGRVLLHEARRTAATHGYTTVVRRAEAAIAALERRRRHPGAPAGS